MEWQPPKLKPNWLKRHWKSFLVVGCVVIIILFVVPYTIGTFVTGPFFNKNPNLVDLSGGSETLSANTFDVVANFSLNSTSVVSGTFDASAGITLYVMNQTGYSNIFSNKGFSPYISEDKNAVSGSVNLTVGAQTIYLILLNKNNMPITVNYDFKAIRIA